MKKISDIMNKNLVTISSDTGLNTIIEIMKTKKIGKLPVLNEAKEVLGVVTRDDILVREEKAPIQPVLAFWEVLIAFPNGKDFEEKIKKMSSYRAEDLMTKHPYICTEEDSLEHVITEILERGYEYSLVVKDKKLVGMITKSDLIERCF